MFLEFFRFFFIFLDFSDFFGFFRIFFRILWVYDDFMNKKGFKHWNQGVVHSQIKCNDFKSLDFFLIFRNFFSGCPTWIHESKNVVQRHSNCFDRVQQRRSFWWNCTRPTDPRLTHWPRPLSREQPITVDPSGAFSLNQMLGTRKTPAQTLCF